MKKNLWRAALEIGFIVFLFYSNLLMGEFERTGVAQQRGFTWAIEDVVTGRNLGIAIVAAAIGYVVVEFLRAKF